MAALTASCLPGARLPTSPRRCGCVLLVQSLGRRPALLLSLRTLALLLQAALAGGAAGLVGFRFFGRLQPCRDLLRGAARGPARGYVPGCGRPGPRRLPVVPELLEQPGALGIAQRGGCLDSKTASIRESVTLACCPPGPEERLARNSISPSGIERSPSMRSGSSMAAWQQTTVCVGCSLGPRSSKPGDHHRMSTATTHLPQRPPPRFQGGRSLRWRSSAARRFASPSTRCRGLMATARGVR